MEIRLNGIILGKKDVGEADRLYSIFTLEKGKIQAVAKGVRKSQARLAGSLENFNLVSFTVVGKSGTKKITHAVVEENFSTMRKKYESLSLVFKMLMVFDMLVEKGEKDEELYFQLIDYLRTINGLVKDRERMNELISQGFILKILMQLGYKFEIIKCVNCGIKLKSGNNYFKFDSGGVICGNCQKNWAGGMRISDNTIKTIRIIYQNQLASLVKLQAGKKEIDELKAITNGYLRWIAK